MRSHAHTLSILMYVPEHRVTTDSELEVISDDGWLRLGSPETLRGPTAMERRIRSRGQMDGSQRRRPWT